MATIVDKLKWKLYKKKRLFLIYYGLKTGLIKPYDEDLIARLRSIYYGGIPASIILLSKIRCQGYCQDRIVFLSLAFDDFRLLTIEIDGIKLNPEYVGDPDETYAYHKILEHTDERGITWVYDTSFGLVVEKSLYYRMERPRIVKINSKEETMNYCEYQDIKNADIEKDKYVAPLILPLIEALVPREKLYQSELLREIELYKKSIDYDSIVREREKYRKTS